MISEGQDGAFSPTRGQLNSNEPGLFDQSQSWSLKPSQDRPLTPQGHFKSVLKKDSKNKPQIGFLAKIAKEHGFEKPEPWIREILDGTSHIHKSDKNNSFKKIVDMVASKGGVTEAALNKINEEGIENIWNQAINDAIIKSKALGD